MVQSSDKQASGILAKAESELMLWSLVILKKIVSAARNEKEEIGFLLCFLISSTHESVEEDILYCFCGLTKM